MIHAFRWTKKRAIGECLAAFSVALDQGSLLPALVLTRTIFEHIGVVALLDRELSSVKRGYASPIESGDWVLDIQLALVPRLMGTRIDWEDYLRGGLKRPRGKGYEAREGYFDQEAKDLLKGIDVLDKSVKGARNAYEFLSEYGHPNVPTFHLGAVSVELTPHRLGFKMLRKLYAGDKAPRYAVDQQRKLLSDVRELLASALERFQELDKRLEGIENEVQGATRAHLRDRMRVWRDTDIFRLGDPCPCLSGRIVGGCCGAPSRR